MSEKVQAWAKILLLFVLIPVVIQWILPAATSGALRQRIESLGIFGPLVVIIYTVVSHVFAPVAGSPGMIMGLSLFGIVQTSFYLYVGSLISAVINFYIAKIFGRQIVEKLAGKHAMTDIDNFVSKAGNSVLIFCRLFGFPIFEIISYAAGLTNIRFRDYFLITAVCGAIPNIFMILIFRHTDFSDPVSLLFWFGSIIIIGAIFIWTIRRYLQTPKSEKPTQ